MLARFARGSQMRPAGGDGKLAAGRWLTLALLTVGLALAAPALAAPQRIASLNLCTDQLLLMLVERERIVSVSHWAHRPESSYMVAAARGIPANGGLAEEVVPLAPDLIITGRFSQGAVTNLLRQLGYPVVVTEVPRTLAEGRRSVLDFGALVGAEDAAAALVAAMDARLAAIDAVVAADPQRPLAAVYAPNGVTAGAGTVMHDVVSRAGMRNLAAELGVVGYGQLPLERLIAAAPDVVVLDATAAPQAAESMAHRYLRHPALQALLAQARVVTLPPPLSVCVGPMTIDAIERLVAVR